MSSSVTKAGPYFSSGSISFSSLRNTFKEISSGSIKASELKRNTNTSETNPIVPDATENTAVSSSNNLKISQFRNTIKYYYIAQTGTDENLDIHALSWNSNLNKTIKKWFYIQGIIGSNNVSVPAAKLSASAYNLTVDVSGNILGAGGIGGGLSAADPTGILLPFQRYFSVSLGGLHFYSADPAIEFITQNGYVLENTTAFYTYTTQVTNTIPLYRAYKSTPPAGPHILTTDQNEYNSVIASGWTPEGVVGYVYSSSVTGTVPVYRAYKGSNGDFLYSTSSTEITNAVSQFGYTDEGTAFYAPIESISGEAGGNALQIISSGMVIVNINSGAKIYGGGGGGEKGATGANGSSGTCVNTTTTQGCGGKPGCPSGYVETGQWSGGCCQSTSYCCGLFDCGCERCVQNLQGRYCRQEYTVSEGVGGEGGNGGPGRGYNNQSGSLDGAAGSAGGANNGCGSTDGATGETGGLGGEWAKSGGNTNNTGNGGAAGSAIVGSNYSVTGTINSDTVKGSYN